MGLGLLILCDRRGHLLRHRLCELVLLLQSLHLMRRHVDLMPWLTPLVHRIIRSLLLGLLLGLLLSLLLVLGLLLSLLLLLVLLLYSKSL